MKISCSMIAWCEAQTIDLALKSVVDFADEVIIIDTGSFDGTQKIAREWIERLDLSGQVKKLQIKTLGEARLESFLLCSGDWVLMQDSNLVLSDALKAELRRNGERHPKSILAVRSLNLIGDYDHYLNNRPFMAAHRVFVNREWAKWSMDLDRLVFKGDKRTVSNWAVNLSRVRPAWRCWYRGEPFDSKYYKGRKSGSFHEANTQRQWMRTGCYHSLVEYVESENGLTLEKVKRIAPEWYLTLIQREAVRLKPRFRKGLPETIREEFKSPRYELIYEGGKIIGRCPEL